MAQVGKVKYLSTLDLSQGYHQVPLDEDSIPNSGGAAAPATPVLAGPLIVGKKIFLNFFFKLI